MTDESGAFFSTQDADSEGEEGKFFVWTPAEIAEVLGEADAIEFCAIYDITAEGNFEGHNIPNIRGGTGGDLGASSGAGKSSDIDIGSEKLRTWRRVLFDHREKRIKPFRDEKVLTAWNGLMLAAFAEAAAVLNNSEYLDAAKKNADFLLSELRTNGRLLRTWKEGRAKLNGYIEDYANLADGLIELYQVSGDVKYLHTARELTDAMITEFWDEENGGFFFTSNDHEELIVRNKDFFDNATPSGNSVAADVLLKLSKLYGEEKYERFASTVLRLSAQQVKRFPSGFGRMLSAMEFMLSPVKEIAIVGEKGSDVEREVWSGYRPFKVMATGGAVPLLEGREPLDGQPTVYVCENFVCQRPVTNAGDLKELLD